jgi:hypothetical protein
MASFVGVNNRVYLNHLDLTGQVNRVEFGTITTQMKDGTTFADGGFMCPKPGMMSGAASLQGFQDYTADVLDDEISITQMGTQYPLSVIACPTGTVTAGDTAWMSRGILSTANPLNVTKGELAGFELGLTYDTAIVQAKVAAAKAAVTVDTNGTAVAMTGPTATQKLWASLHVFAYSSFTNAVFTIQSDDNGGFGSPTTRITFTTVTAVGGQFASVAGSFSSETHHRVAVDVTGSGSITYAAFFGVL